MELKSPIIAEESQKMSSLQKKGDAWYCQFIYHGKRHTFTVGKVEPDEAEAKANQVDYLLMRLKRGHMRLPPGMDIVTFIELDGKPPDERRNPCPGSISLKKLREKYLSTHEGSLEQSTLDGIGPHFKHLAGTLGEGFPVQELTMADLQSHHIFRHSFISLCASKGTDQRLIDEWTGHCTEEQRRRYRHLFPTTQRQAILSVFGQ